MLRRSMFAAALAAATLAQLAPASAESSTIRIEPRPYYGAVVTVEQGVRVWRPLPPTRMMIINPTGSPVHVNVADVRETINHNGPAYGAAPLANGYGPGHGHSDTYRVPGYLGGPFIGRGQHGFRRAVGHNGRIGSRAISRR